MAMRSASSFGPKASLAYITIGALMTVWTAVWYFAFRDPAIPLSSAARFWVSGLFLSGLMLVAIGLLLGPLGRNARQAELPPRDEPADLTPRATNDEAAPRVEPAPGTINRSENETAGIS